MKFIIINSFSRYIFISILFYHTLHTFSRFSSSVGYLHIDNLTTDIKKTIINQSREEESIKKNRSFRENEKSPFADAMETTFEARLYFPPDCISLHCRCIR